MRKGRSREEEEEEQGREVKEEEEQDEEQTLRPLRLLSPWGRCESCLCLQG
jgi:hypothetical protein